VCALLVGAGLARPVGAQTVWTLAGDFSAVSSTAGAWSYGWTPTLGGTFTPYDHLNTAGAVQIWTTASGYPALEFNPTGSLIQLGTVFFPATTVVQHPGPGGEFSVARWTAPATGIYAITAAFVSSDAASATTGVFVRQNSSTLASGNVDVSTPFAYSLSSLSLTAGDTIEFSLNYGLNFNYGFDTTVTIAVITAVPEPMTSALLAGAAALGAAIWQRRRR
jgi:hypothetical protein